MIKLLILDVDGTMTNGQVHISDNGELFKSFNIKDGYGIHDILPKIRIEPVIITGRNSKILEIRCKELGIKYLFQGIQNKKEKLIEILKNLNCNFDNCAYMGDDLNDYECMLQCKIKACPEDAVEEIKNICDYISTKNGGEGAVRDFIDFLKNLN